MLSYLNKAKNKLDEAELLKKVQPHTLMSHAKLKNLRYLAKLVNEQAVEGDFVECGTYKGGSAGVLGSVLPPGRHLWLYDSFKGMPEVSDIDGEDARQAVGACLASPEDVRKILGTLNVPEEQYTIREGMFDETFKEPLPERVALLHCDADWYNSVTIVLETFYARIPEGGCIILDDFGYWEGCREAFYDFCFRHGEKPLLERVGVDQAYWIKGKTHNRT
jgi:O-methyltransferase